MPDINYFGTYKTLREDLDQLKNSDILKDILKVALLFFEDQGSSISRLRSIFLLLW